MSAAPTFTAGVCVRNFKGSYPDRLLKCTGGRARQNHICPRRSAPPCCTAAAAIICHRSPGGEKTVARICLIRTCNSWMLPLNDARLWSGSLSWRAEESSSGVDRIPDNAHCLRRTISQIKELLQTVASPCWDNLRNVDASAAYRLRWINVWAEKAKELKCK